MEIIPTLANAGFARCRHSPSSVWFTKGYQGGFGNGTFPGLARFLLTFSVMLRRLARLFVIRTRWEAWAIIYALSVGATTRGWHYIEIYPGFGGYLLFLACTGAVFMGGAKILDAVPRKWSGEERRRVDRRQPQVPQGGTVEL